MTGGGIGSAPARAPLQTRDQGAAHEAEQQDDGEDQQRRQDEEQFDHRLLPSAYDSHATAKAESDAATKKADSARCRLMPRTWSGASRSVFQHDATDAVRAQCVEKDRAAEAEAAPQQQRARGHHDAPARFQNLQRDAPPPGAAIVRQVDAPPGSRGTAGTAAVEEAAGARDGHTDEHGEGAGIPSTPRTGSRAPRAPDRTTGSRAAARRTSRRRRPTP